jgi:hypothetical protein
MTTVFALRCHYCGELSTASGLLDYAENAISAGWLKRRGWAMCPQCRLIAASMFPPERPRGLEAAPLGRWLNQLRRQMSLKELGRTMATRFNSNPLSEARHLLRIANGHTLWVQLATADRILTAFNGPSIESLYGSGY